MLHAVERPMNLDYVKPFANTSDLINFTPNINEQVAKAKADERAYSQKVEQQAQGAEVDNTPVETIVLEEEREESGSTTTQSVNHKQSKFEQKEEKQAQEFKLTYKREHAIAYLQRKMPYNFTVYKRIMHEL